MPLPCHIQLLVPSSYDYNWYKSGRADHHDAASVVTKNVRLPEGVFEFSSRSAETFLLDELKVALHGRSFSERAVPENYASSYPSARPGMFNIGVLHTSCDGRPGHNPYAPCSLDDLVSKGYQYWALGHIHAYEQLHSDPHVVFPGNLQGRGVHECGARGALLVTVNEDEVTVERLIVDRARWFDLAIAMEAVADLNEIHDRLGNLLRPLVAEVEANAESRLLLIRIRLQGCTTLHAALRSGRVLQHDDVQATLQHFGQDIWLEQLKIETTEPVEIQAAAGLSADTFDLRSVLDSIAASDALQIEAKQIIDELVRKLPAGASEEAIFGHIRVDDLITEARERLLDRTGAGDRGRS
jgi:exonuclease SbcD